MKKSSIKIYLFLVFLFCFEKSNCQLNFIQHKDSCELFDGKKSLSSIFCNCDILKKDTILLIKTILNGAKDRGGSTLLYGYPYKDEDSDIYPCSSLDCRNIGKCALQRNQLFCAHFFVYDVLFRQRINRRYYISIKSGKNRYLNDYDFTFCEHPNQRLAKKKKYHKNYKNNPNDPRMKDVKKIKKLYSKWLIEIEKVGLEGARKQNISPFKNTKYKWSMDVN
jgi:hypothetical protein